MNLRRGGSQSRAVQRPSVKGRAIGSVITRRGELSLVLQKGKNPTLGWTLDNPRPLPQKNWCKHKKEVQPRTLHGGEITQTAPGGRGGAGGPPQFGLLQHCRSIPTRRERSSFGEVIVETGARCPKESQPSRGPVLHYPFRE